MVTLNTNTTKAKKNQLTPNFVHREMHVFRGTAVAETREYKH